MKLFTALALVTVNTAAAAAASIVTADLLYVAADNVDADASSHQKDVIANQDHVADEVSDDFL